MWRHSGKLKLEPERGDSGSHLAYSRDLLADHNPTVVANAVAALVEISDRSDEITLRLNATVAGKLVAALGECSE